MVFAGLFADVALANVDKAASRQTADAFIDVGACRRCGSGDTTRRSRRPSRLPSRCASRKGPEIMEFKPALENGALRVGGNIKAPQKVKDVRPVYPPLAREANVTGVVIIEVRIGTDGQSRRRTC